MSELSQERLEVELALKPEPLTSLVEDESWLHVGAVSISKRFARFSAGFVHPMVPTTHFVVQPFIASGTRGLALVLVSGGNPSHYFAGWLRAEEEARASLWVDKLNVQIQQRVAPQLREGAERDQADGIVRELSAQALACRFVTFGREEVVRLVRDGGVEYVRRANGEQQQRVRGRVDPARFVTLVSTLAATSFPTPPQRFFTPDALICTLVLEPPERRMSLQFDTAQHLYGYGEILQALASLCSALRDSKPDVLTEWQFEQARSE